MKSSDSKLKFTPLKCPIANEGDKSEIVIGSPSTIDRVSQTYGIPEVFSRQLSDGGMFFQRKHLNGLLNLISQYQYYLQAGGFQTFDEEVSSAIGGYPNGAILFYQAGANSCFVKSLVDNNTADFTKDPALIGTNQNDESEAKPWLQVSPSIEDVRRGFRRIKVVDDLPSDYEEGVFYFVRG